MYPSNIIYTYNPSLEVYAKLIWCDKWMASWQPLLWSVQYHFDNYCDMIIGHGWMRVMMKIGGDQLCDILDHWYPEPCVIPHSDFPLLATAAAERRVGGVLVGGGGWGGLRLFIAVLHYINNEYSHCFFSESEYSYLETKSLGPLPTSSWRPFGPAWLCPSRPSGAQAVWPTPPSITG